MSEISPDDAMWEDVCRVLHKERIFTRLDHLEEQINGGAGQKQKALDHALGARALSLMKLLQAEEIVDGGAYVRLGRDYDGGYVMYDPAIRGSIAYSFGINDDVSWDEDMVKRGFDVYMYDHTIEGLPYEDDRFHWVRQGIAGAGETDELKTLAHHIEKNGHTDRTDLVMKIDVEGYEWDVFSRVEDAVLSQFQQIVIELHWFDHIERSDLYEKMMKSLAKLQRIFAPVHVHSNNNVGQVILGNVAVTPLLEITYVRRTEVKTKPNTRIFPTALDQPNNPAYPDIFLGNFRFS